MSAYEETGKQGFASMDKEKQREIAQMGGEARKEQLGHEGYVEMGKMGGEARKEQLGHEGYVDLGKMGGAVAQGRQPNNVVMNEEHKEKIATLGDEARIRT